MKTKELPRAVHWLSWLPTPYNDYLFQALTQCPDIDLTVHYRERISSAHPWRTKLGQGHNSRYYHLRGGVDWTILNIARHDKEAFFVIAGWEHPTSMLLITFLALTGRRFALWTDTPNLHRKRNPLFAFLRSQWLRWVFQRGTKIMGTGRPGVEALRNMGAPPAALVEFPFFLDLQRYAPPDRLSVTQGHPMRFISSGRLQNDRKGHDLALRAFALVAHKRGFNGEYLIAGTGPDETLSLIHI